MPDLKDSPSTPSLRPSFPPFPSFYSPPLPLSPTFSSLPPSLFLSPSLSLSLSLSLPPSTAGGDRKAQDLWTNEDYTECQFLFQGPCKTRAWSLREGWAGPRRGGWSWSRAGWREGTWGGPRGRGGGGAEIPW